MNQSAAALSRSKGVVTKYVRLTGAAEQDWPAARELDESALERRLLTVPHKSSEFVQPGDGRAHDELRCRDMAPMLLWKWHRAKRACSYTYTTRSIARPTAASPGA